MKWIEDRCDRKIEGKKCLIDLPRLEWQLSFGRSMFKFQNAHE